MNIWIMVANKYLVYIMINNKRLNFLTLHESLIECTTLCRNMSWIQGMLVIDWLSIFYRRQWHTYQHCHILSKYLSISECCWDSQLLNWTISDVVDKSLSFSLCNWISLLHSFQEVSLTHLHFNRVLLHKFKPSWLQSSLSASPAVSCGSL